MQVRVAEDNSFKGVGRRDGGSPEAGIALGNLGRHIFRQPRRDVLLGILMVDRFGELDLAARFFADEPKQLDGEADLVGAGSLLVGLAA